MYFDVEPSNVILFFLTGNLTVPGFDAHDPPYTCGIYYLHVSFLNPFSDIS